MDRTLMRNLSRCLLEGVRLDHFAGDDGRPTAACWERVEAGTLSSGERVLVALAMALMDYQMPAPPTVDRLLLLDHNNLLVVASVLARLGAWS
jgi:hypothetical protein